MRSTNFVAITLAVLLLLAPAARANITTAIVLNPDPVAPGAFLLAEVTVANNGSDSVDAVNLDVTIPAYVITSNTNLAEAGATSSNGHLLWNLGDLPSGRAFRRMVRLTVQSGINAPPEGSSINVVAVATYITNPLLPPLTATASRSVPVESAAPLSLRVTVDKNPVRPSQDLVYTLYFGNRGVANASDTTLEFRLPERVTYLTSDGGALGNNVVHWDLDELAAGQSGRRQVVVRLDDTVMSGTMLRPQDATLTGNVSGIARSARGPSLTQVRDTPMLGLAVEMTPDPARIHTHPSRISEPLRTSFVVSNQSGLPLNDVRLFVDQSLDDAYFGGSNATGDLSCGISCIRSPFRWSLGNLSPGQSTVVTMFPEAGNRNQSPDEGSLIPYTAQVRADGTREALITRVVPVGSANPLNLLVTDDADPLVVGSALTYTLTYGNLGNTVASGVMLTFPVPAGLQVVSASGGGQPLGTVVQWNLPDLAAGEANRQQVRLLATGLGAGDIINIESVRLAAEVGGVNQSAWGEVTTRVVDRSDLQLGVEVNPDPFRSGERLYATFNVANPSDQPLTNVILDVERYYHDAYFRRYQATGGATCVSDCNELVRWSLGAIGPRETRTVTMFPLAGNGDFSPLDGQPVPFTARAVADGGHVSLVSRVVAPDAAGPLSLELVESGDPVQPGGAVDYSILFGNRGAVTAQGATLTVPVPAGLSVSSSSGGALADGALTWSLGNIPQGGGGLRSFRLAGDGNLPTGAILPIDAAVLQASVSGVMRRARATASIRTEAAAPLVVKLSSTPRTVQGGQAIALNATIINRGSDELTNIVITLVPAYEIQPSNSFVLSSGGACVSDGCENGIRWTILALSAGASTTVSASSSVRSSTNAPPSGRLIASLVEARYSGGKVATASDASLVGPTVDSDNDGVANGFDNCTLLSNGIQCDSDGDGYGNHCDGDMNNNGSTNAQDTTLYRQQLGQPSIAPTFNKADLNCSGAVNAQDTTLFRQRLGSAPGPSGLH